MGISLWFLLARQLASQLVQWTVPLAWGSAPALLVPLFQPVDIEHRSAITGVEPIAVDALERKHETA